MPFSSLPVVTLGLGSNLGDRVGYLADAVRLLTDRRTGPIVNGEVSILVESSAMLLPGSPPEWNIPFLNLVVKGATSATPVELLRAVKAIESSLGRRERERWAPREIDVDILTFGDFSVRTPDLRIPHAGIGSRAFVIVPLHDVAPDIAKMLGLPYESQHDDDTVPADVTAQRRFVHCLRGASVCVKRVRRTISAKTPSIAAILNCTPDSFSDGGIDPSPDAAVERAIRMVDDGATVVDVGAESTRPGAVGLSSEEEEARLLPVLETLIARRSIERREFSISVDTRNFSTARAALRCGADWINDVSGFSDPRMIEACADATFPVVVMHNLGVPPSRDNLLDHAIPAVEQVLRWFDVKMLELEVGGISRNRVIIDPGIGFGKTPEQSFDILRDAERLWTLGRPILIGHSRKSFLSLVGEKASADRDCETAIVTALLAPGTVDWLRVHAVPETVRALRIAKLCGVDDR